MKSSLQKLLQNLDKNDAPDPAAYSALLAKIDFRIDEDFLEFIKTYDGAEGEMGRNYLMLWNIEDILALNPYYEDIPECEKLFFFGSDGSSYGYAFEKDGGKIVGIDFLDIGEKEADFHAESFIEFLRKVK